jgi:hypothetical protein
MFSWCKSLIFPIKEGENVSLRNSRSFGSVKTGYLGASADGILKSWELITKKYQIADGAILRILKITEQAHIIDFGGDVVSFFYWLDILEKAGATGVKNLVQTLLREKSTDSILSDIFVGFVAAKYVENHRVELTVRKKENGTDLSIDGLKCDGKIRMGFWEPLSTDLTSCTKDNWNSLRELAQKERARIFQRAVQAFEKQGADVVFVNVERTSVGIQMFLTLESLIDSKEVTGLPALAKRMMVFHAKFDEKDYWKTRVITHEEIRDGRLVFQNT